MGSKEDHRDRADLYSDAWFCFRHGTLTTFVNVSDAPPALAKLASQVAALTTKPSVSSLDEPTVTASVTPKYTAASQPKPLKSGFFNAPKAQKKSYSSKVCQIADGFANRLLPSSYDMGHCTARELQQQSRISKLSKALQSQATS